LSLTFVIVSGGATVSETGGLFVALNHRLQALLCESEANMHWPPKYTRRGLLRIYILLACAWIIGIGYISVGAHRAAIFSGEREDSAYAAEQDFMDDAVKNNRPISKAQLDKLGVPFESWKRKRQEMFARRNTALMALPLVPLGLPLLWVIYVWVASGFRPKNCR
jgi:hypothetical protein